MNYHKFCNICKTWGCIILVIQLHETVLKAYKTQANVPSTTCFFWFKAHIEYLGLRKHTYTLQFHEVFCIMLALLHLFSFLRTFHSKINLKIFKCLLYPLLLHAQPKFTAKKFPLPLLTLHAFPYKIFVIITAIQQFITFIQMPHYFLQDSH
jgi:hypothetical protein